MATPVVLRRRRLLVAGSVGPERFLARPDPEEPRWFEPLHIRDEAAARARIADQVAAGADAIVAPTWLTHRRALLPVGETRRARDWTASAVRVARDAIEVGLERREEARSVALESESRVDATMSPPLTAPLIGAVLPELDGDSEPGDGRLLPRDAAIERDYRDQAGLLAETDPDFVLVEGQRTITEARTAVDEATASGLATWVAAPRVLAGGADDGAPLARWIEHCRHSGAELLLLPGPVATSARQAQDAKLWWGGLLRAGGAGNDGRAVAVRTAAWLDAKAGAIAILDGATSEALTEARATIDERDRADIDAHLKVDARWTAHLTRAARMAPGGAALWLGPGPESPPPDGFDWLVVDTADWHQLPKAHYRLIVVNGDLGPTDVVGLLLEDRGILVRAVEQAGEFSEELRLISLDTESEPTLALYRRED